MTTYRVGPGNKVPTDLVHLTSEMYDIFGDGTKLFFGKHGAMESDYWEYMYELAPGSELAHTFDRVQGYKAHIEECIQEKRFIGEIPCAAWLILEAEGRM